MEVKHVTFNPKLIGPSYSVLAPILETWEADGWELDRVIPHREYESIAVLHRGEDTHSTMYTALPRS